MKPLQLFISILTFSLVLSCNEKTKAPEVDYEAKQTEAIKEGVQPFAKIILFAIYQC